MGFRIFCAVLAADGLGLAGGLLATSPGALPGSLILAGVSAYFVNWVVRPVVLAVDDAGLHVRKTFRIRHIPWATVRAFRVKQYVTNVEVRAVLHTGEKAGVGGAMLDYVVPGARRIAAELTQALHEHNQAA